MATSSTPKKTGRPRAVFKASDGTHVPGLLRLKDGRCRISGPEKMTFTEPVESRAIARFHELVAKRNKPTFLHKAVAEIQDDRDGTKLRDAIAEAAGSPQEILITPTTTMDGPDIRTTVQVTRGAEEAEFWSRVAHELETRPAYAAMKTGVAWLAWGPKLTKPAASPRLAEVGKLYTDRSDIGEKETSKCRTTWAEFSRAAGVATLRELTPEAVANWGMSVKKRGLAAKTTHHAFNRVKTILNHYRTTGVAIDDVRHALDCCAVLKAPETTSLDPHPIGRVTFAKLLENAEGEGKAMLLVALNLCMYPIDLVRLKWSELDPERGLYHAKRGKTKVARCGVLWSRTIDALNTIPRADDGVIFHKDNGQPHTATTIRKWFWALRETAGVAKDVQLADIRDGSFTEAVAGEGVEFQHARVLAGHRSGIADAYVLRNPKMVAKACAAVEQAYFGG